MIRLEDIKEDTILRGVVPSQAVRVVRVDRLSDQAISLTYKTEGGQIHETMLFRTDEASLVVLDEGRPWSFDADGEAFKLAAEAYRINLAYLFDPMMAVHTSTIEPLPHQIAAVYQSMLPRQPLRYLLADDPGAGKTIMAGLLIRELLMRADAERILIIAPGSLVEQWQDEMYEKFGLEFQIFSRDKLEQSRSGNPFNEENQVIARLDQLSRSDDLKGLLEHTQWDLVVVDEAHKMSATYFGNEFKPTLRFRLGQLIGKNTRHLLLMTATPHNGKEEDFQAFLSLLDSDRFYGKPRDGPHTINASDLMHRMVKEDLVTFEGKPLFPERKAYTVNYTLSDPEIALYENVTKYVREEMNKADQIEDGSRRGSVGFALTSLQRRLASSPEAIYQSLQRRKKRLQTRIDEMKASARGSSAAAVLNGFSYPRYYEDADEELTSEEYEDYEEKVVDQATASHTIAELEIEVETLARLEEQAKNYMMPFGPQAYPIKIVGWPFLLG